MKQHAVLKLWSVGSVVHMYIKCKAPPGSVKEVAK